jgi:hypothetical protein
MLYAVQYHTLISPQNVQSYDQTPDQACMAIGDAIVAGFTVQRYQVKDREEHGLTVVATISPAGVLFGAYEFTRLV